MRTHHFTLVVSLLCALLLAIGCGDNDYSIGTHPELQVSIQEDQVSFQDEDGEVSFGQALQLPISKTIVLRNTGNEDLIIEDVNWETNEDGAVIHNPYVTLTFTESPACTGGAVVTEAKSCRFMVLYTPPVGKALDDFTPSTIVVRSNAYSDKGNSATPEVRITFSMPQKIAAPQVNPPNYTFNNATISKPESHTFKIGNDTDIGTTSFSVLDIKLENSSAEFKLVNKPNLPALIYEPNSLDYDTVEFTVTYQPVDQGNDNNAVLVYTDVADTPIRVTLSSGFVSGSYEVTYDHVNEWDFTNVNTVATRSMQIQSMGPGPITIDEPWWEPDEMSESFTWAAFLVATSAGSTDTPITSWPRALTTGKSIRFEITYQPPSSGEPHNGVLAVPYENPDDGIIEVPVYAGNPKPDMQIAPPNGSVLVNTIAAEAATGERHVVIYNKGNGDLSIHGVSVQGSSQFVEPKVFTLVDPPAASPEAPLVVTAHSLQVFKVAWDGGEISDLEGENERFVVEYFDPYTGTVIEKFIGLVAFDQGDVTEIPVADPGTYETLTVGEAVSLNGVTSSTGPSSFDFGAKSHWWYLTGKPAGSQVYLNTEGTLTQSFTPDVAGEYTLELQVKSDDSGAFLVSEPVSFTLYAQ
ncbi:MAG: hypothetical protein CL940_08045 [Deltaproteobacteria bacterium]|nr:hypothetical protein [Deltaproteobacteria bacterium]